MITWDSFFGFAIPTIALWTLAIILQYSVKKQLWAQLSTVAGIVLFAIFIGELWLSMERPPMRTMGETRLWYSFFLASVGSITYLKWRYKWILSYSLIVAIVFILVNIFKPELHSKNLMPALQSIWFVPHVTAYILAYSLLGAATIVSVAQLYKPDKINDEELSNFADNLVYIGFGLLILGMLMGAKWAKEAWGHYWSWDPKETWAFITAAAYLLYIHMRLQSKHRRFTLWLLPVAFIFLMITWKGVNYLPAAKNSVHVYSQ